MFLTAELSLYPLTDDYEAGIITFINKLKENPEIEVYTHAMSTFIKGESLQVLTTLNTAMSEVDALGPTFSLAVKMINKNLPVDKGFLAF